MSFFVCASFPVTYLQPSGGAFCERCWSHRQRQYMHHAQEWRILHLEIQIGEPGFV